MPPPEFRAGPPPGVGGYRGYGGYPSGQSTAAPPAAPPSTLNTALWLVIANAVPNMIGLIYTFSRRDELVDQIMQDRAFTGAEAEAAVNTGIAVVLVIGMAFALFYIFLAVKTRAGRNWARITLTVFLALGLLLGLAGLGGDNTSAAKGLGGISLILDAVALVLIWLPASNAYIAARNRPSW